MVADSVQTAKKWRGKALILLLSLVASLLLVAILRGATPVLALLSSLLLSLIILVLISGVAQTERRTSKAWSKWVFPTACSIIALAMSMSGLNGSSSACVSWGVDGAPSSIGLIAGTPKLIRSDEWMVQTPWLLSQARQAHPFSAHNPSVGGERAPLVNNLPVKHWSACFRPEFWIFFTGLDPEWSFMFYWNFKWWSLLCGSYALLFLVTRGESLLAGAGALILYWSATIQWWFSSPSLMPDMVGLWCFAVAAGFGAVVHSKRSVRILLSAAYAFCLLGFLFCCYPPFQIPLLTLLVPLLIALVFDRQTERRWVGLGVATAFVAIGAGVFAWQLRETFSAELGLVYPGRRFSTGGGVRWTSIVDGFLTLGATDRHYPNKYENIVAAASFLNPLPLLACIYVARWRRSQRRDVVLTILLGFAGLLAFFAVCGFPRFIAAISLWSFVTSERLSVTLAVVSVLAICRFLSWDHGIVSSRPWHWTILISVLVFGALLILDNQELDRFVAPSSLIAIWLFYSVTGLFLAARIRIACLALIILPLAILHGGVNPLSHGIPGYKATSLSPMVEDLRKQFPEIRWIVLESFPRTAVISSIMKTTGATVLSGVIAMPHQEMLDRLDPRHEQTSVYSRYASVCFVAADESVTDPEFELQHTTIYSIHLPLTDEWLQTAGVDGIVVPEKLQVKIPKTFREVGLSAGFRFCVRSLPHE